MLKAEAVTKSYGGRKIIDGVDLTLQQPQAVGLVGLSGAGKSTLIRLLLALEKPDSGRVSLNGEPTEGTGKLRWFRRQVQYVPQNPAATLPPHRTVAQTLAEPLICLKADKTGKVGEPGKTDNADSTAKAQSRKTKIIQALEQVGLDASFAARRPHQLSGGQAQRVAIARAIITGPAFVLADEPVSSLDKELRDLILDLLEKLRREIGLGVLLVTHDLEAAAKLCETTMVLHQGKIVEHRATAELIEQPGCEITQRMVESMVSA